VAFALVLSASLVTPPSVSADGCFVWKWDKDADIREPAQKAIILYDGGREDLILQVKFEGAVRDFGWLIPVPGRPQVAQASIASFYELSHIVQRRAGTMRDEGKDQERPGVALLEIKTVGVYQTAILAATDNQALKNWLKTNGFNPPARGDQILQDYIGKGWYFVAVRINVPDTAAPDTAAKLHTGELHPLKISFDTKGCLYPLKISSLNGNETLVQIYTISSDLPLVCADMDFLTAQASFFQADIKTSGIAFDTGSSVLKDLPTLAGRRWHLFKHSQNFKPAEMNDLAFVPAGGKALTDACETRLGEWLATDREQRAKSLEGRSYYPVIAAYHAPRAFDRIVEELFVESDFSQLAWLDAIDWEKAVAAPEGLACLLARKWLTSDSYEQRLRCCGLLCRMKSKAAAGVRLLTTEMTDPKNRRPHLHFYMDESVGRLLRECPDEESLARLIQLYRDLRKTDILRSSPSSHDMLVRALAETRSPIAADALAEYLDEPPVSLPLALLAMGDRRAADALTKAVLHNGWGCGLFAKLVDLDRDAAVQCMIKVIDANPTNRIVGGDDVGRLVAAGLTDKQYEALFARVFSLHRSAHTDPIFRGYVEHLYKVSLNETDGERLRVILRNVVRAREQLTYRNNPDPVDALIGKIAIRAYESKDVEPSVGGGGRPATQP
jgi:hypothetical protein